LKEEKLTQIKVVSPKQEQKKRYPSQWDLMLLAEEQDSEAFEAQDFENNDQTFEQRYKEFYDDVKRPADYVKEDW